MGNPCFGQSILDNDLYKLTMMQFVWKFHRDRLVRYRSTNRGKTPMPKGFAESYRKQIEMYSQYQFSQSHIYWLSNLELFEKEFLDYLKNFTLDANDVNVGEDDEGNFVINIEGPWIRTILWEVPALYIWSSLYYQMTDQHPNGYIYWDNLEKKVQMLDQVNANVFDFGTRRRQSFASQIEMVKYYQSHAPESFGGTSNMHIAYHLGVNVKGTFAHEAVMAMQGIYGVLEANDQILSQWKMLYGDKLKVALTDTFTSDFFLDNLSDEMAEHYTAFRQDSGDPTEIGWKFINFWRSRGIDPKSRTILFSDSLDAKKTVKLIEVFGDITNVAFGIGTFLSNDCGLKPLNIVIKMTHIYNRIMKQWIEVVKLSDTNGKHHGSNESVTNIKLAIAQSK